jgi:predicted Zn-ribbon and HTH transcriptional regulator
VEHVGHDLIADAKNEYDRAIREAIDASGVSLAELLKGLTGIDRDKQTRMMEAFASAIDRLNQAIESIVGRCSCGGSFGLEAPIRCPSCGSTNVQHTRGLTHYI